MITAKEAAKLRDVDCVTNLLEEVEHHVRSTAMMGNSKVVLSDSLLLSSITRQDHPFNQTHTQSVIIDILQDHGYSASMVAVPFSSKEFSKYALEISWFMDGQW